MGVLFRSGRGKQPPIEPLIVLIKTKPAIFLIRDYVTAD